MGVISTDVIKATGLELVTQQAFAGVNYMEALSTKSAGKKGFDGVSNLLDPGGSGAEAEAYSSLQHNVSSLFNKFTVFQYAPLNNGAKYEAAGHFIGFSNNLKTDTDYAEESGALLALQKLALESAQSSATSADAKKKTREALSKWEASAGALQKVSRNFRANSQSVLSNPTAAQLRKWGSETSPGTPVGFQPYSYSDFMYCKHYGKIPNNRLVTLRRYPFPVGDSLKTSQTDPRKNAIPVAQAITWFGSDTGNDLNKLGLFSWDIPWTPLDVTEQEITGNEVTFSDLISTLEPLAGGAALASTLKAAYATINGTDQSAQELSGMDKKIQQYQKNLYTTGPYWNRIYGPVNVISQSTRRARGMQTTNWQNTMTINFAYKFRSFNGLSPKIAALDLISNFMNLTYNDAQFLGQLARYYPKTGLKFSPTTTEALGKILTNWGTTYSGNNSEQYSKILSNMLQALDLAGSKILSDPAKLIGDGIQSALMTQLGNAVPDLISIRSALSDRPVGEWHIVVGNPMNPIFVMGDLLCSNVSMNWDEELGPDDFPTGVTFAVTLKQGKPRDKTAIERMLNMGETKLTAGMLKTSSFNDTFGETNNKLWNEATDPKTANLDKFYAGLGDNKSRFHTFRDRFLTGYGMTTPGNTAAYSSQSASKLDDSLLLYYYQREYGQN